MINYICIVCGYNKLNYPQWNEEGFPTHQICSCCGFESGFDDDGKDEPDTIEEYRNRWLTNGAKWCWPSERPKEWSLKDQLKNIEIGEI